jgi:Fur family transcriptional regulator, ferric uptake regulator
MARLYTRGCRVPRTAMGHHLAMDVAERLRSSGHRLTPQRQLVWDVLQRADHHLSAEGIHERVSETVAEFNLASVYRTLALLAELGLATEVQLGDGRGYWEVAHEGEAFHLHCRVCRRVDHHEGDLVRQIRTHLTGGHDFHPEAIDLVVHGICGGCAAAP